MAWHKVVGTVFIPGRTRLFNLYAAYQPDSQVAFSATPEFDILYKKFITKNRRNNAGDTSRLWSLVLNCKQLMAENIPGEFAELGVWRGNTAAVLAHYATASNRKAYFFDTYAGFDARDLKGLDKRTNRHFINTSLKMVQKVIGDDGASCEYVQGFFPDSIQPHHRACAFAAVSLDCDLYEPTKAGLEFFYPRLSHGGMFFLHDYSSGHWPGAKLAIDEFCKSTGEFLVLMPDKSGSAFFRKAR
ncbi:MAG: TylF/MycF family methyltransferase [Gemmatimonadota bacterium]|nr:TylF/MycF family methyltransferase [Gemmatimonadota bacterium]